MCVLICINKTRSIVESYLSAECTQTASYWVSPKCCRRGNTLWALEYYKFCLIMKIVIILILFERSVKCCFWQSATPEIEQKNDEENDNIEISKTVNRPSQVRPFSSKPKAKKNKPKKTTNSAIKTEVTLSDGPSTQCKNKAGGMGQPCR